MLGGRQLGGGGWDGMGWDGMEGRGGEGRHTTCTFEHGQGVSTCIPEHSHAPMPTPTPTLHPRPCPRNGPAGLYVVSVYLSPMSDARPPRLIKAMLCGCTGSRRYAFVGATRMIPTLPPDASLAWRKGLGKTPGVAERRCSPALSPPPPPPDSSVPPTITAPTFCHDGDWTVHVSLPTT